MFGLSHLHPFRFTVSYDSYKGMSPRMVEVHVGFSMHVFTRRIDCAADDDHAEIYRDEREARVFDHERYSRSKDLRSIVAGLEQRRCFHAKNENFITLELKELPAKLEYRVFFTVRRKSSSAVELVVQSAYVGSVTHRIAGQARKPVRFRVIVMEAIRGQSPTSPP